ncbi:hypothetical protein ACH3Y9_29520 [Streptomyces sp. WSLK1-5]|uniref:hypothetical protein n=1 Tax=unclassified Streptomyces TaxID=2593676 RepID=UPI003790A364
MTALYIDSLAATVRTRPRFQPSGGLPHNHLRRQVADLVARRRGVPLERMTVRQPADNDIADAGDFLIIQRALAALGPQEEDQTLYLVRSGPLLDPLLAPLAATAHSLGWRGDALGVSHLEEQAATLLFGLLAWAVPQDAGATVVIVDDPAYVDPLTESPAYAAVSMRLCREGPLRVHAWGEGLPQGADSRAYTHKFHGARACDAWLALHAALSSGAIGRGQTALLHTASEEREGWVLVEAIEPDHVRLAGSRIEG